MKKNTLNIDGRELWSNYNVYIVPRTADIFYTNILIRSIV